MSLLPIVLNLSLVLFLVFLNGFFVAAEFAMVKVRKSRIQSLIDEGNRKAKFARNLVDHLDAYLSACQLGITLASLGLGWIGEPAIAHLLEPMLTKMGVGDVALHTISFIIAFTIITVLHIVLGELAPKTLAIRKSDSVTLWAAIPMIAFRKVMSPFIWLLNGTANYILKMVGIEPAGEHESAHTEEEIRILMKESHRSGLIDNTELTLVDNIFDFADTHAREIMIPRTEIIGLQTGLAFAENVEFALQKTFTRFPVFEADKDHIVGFVHMKDLLKENRENGQNGDLHAIIRPLPRVPDSIQISNLLKLMQKNRTQMAILFDEYGGTSGLVTMEDIIEEIVGEIQDEFDNERAEIEKLGKHLYSLDGRVLIEEVNQLLLIEIESEDYDTIGGWLISQVELPPEKGQSVSYEGYQFTIEETDQMRVLRVHIEKLAATTEPPPTA
ncbi:hemolysin family protein [Marinicrinis sediminis]|uniref:Hemolysin family protein n=1 Tax=Marinicrinis sediminis TaxID=1652465 RepID=A0ABW5REH9_9BACL